MPAFYTLANWHQDRIVLVCPRCNRRGDYSRASLLKRYGDVLMPDLRLKIAVDGGCEVAANQTDLERCQIVYEGAKG